MNFEIIQVSSCKDACEISRLIELFPAIIALSESKSIFVPGYTISMETEYMKEITYINVTDADVVENCTAIASSLKKVSTKRERPLSTIFSFNSDLFLIDAVPSLPIFKKQAFIPVLNYFDDISELPNINVLVLVDSEHDIRYVIIITLLLATMNSIANRPFSVKCFESIRMKYPARESSSATQLLQMLGWDSLVSKDYALFIDRLSASILRDKNPPPCFIPKNNIILNNLNIDNSIANVKNWPTTEEGVSVFEFFSGIGGMRLSLPSVIRNIPIRKITAFDISDSVNDVYDLNFHSSHSSTCTSMEGVHSRLKRITINGLKLDDVDGHADIWTMSPPCQPYTTTKGAKQLDADDNRSHSLFHLMRLLSSMRYRPSMIFLENVQGFLNSDVLNHFKDTLKACGYRWRQYLLSPIRACNIPNHRMRFYMIIEHCTSVFSKRWSDEDMSIVHTTLESTSQRTEELWTSENVRPLSDFLITDITPEIMSRLTVPADVLVKQWAKQRLSIVGPHDKTSYCITKSYGRIFDKSSGSLLLEDACGPLTMPEYSVDRENLISLHGRLRRFHPRELLNIAGFPDGFVWPDGMPIDRIYAAIGNSINVTVVKMLMDVLFAEHVTSS